MKKKEKAKKPVRARVTYTDPLASSVFLAGSFNDWNAEAAALTQVTPGNWQLELSLPPGRYEYLFVVDGKWVPDPLARDSCPNPHGGINSVVQA